MEQRQLGTGGPEVSALGFGCMVLSGIYDAVDESDALATLDHALDLGVTMFDTADVYGIQNHNENLLARVIKGRRNRMVIATKFGNLRGPNRERLGISGKPDYVHRACDASLARLGVETIDLYYQHRVDPETPIEDTVGAMSELVRAGKVRHIGLSEASAETIRRGHAVHPIAALQSEYSLWSRDIEIEILPTLRELGIGMVPFAPLGRGFLTGRVRSRDDLSEADRQEWPRFSPENFGRNLALLESVEVIARTKGCTLAQIALAWLLAQGKDVVPIPGTRSRARLEENVGSTAVELTAGDLKRLEEAMPRGAAAGDRYPPHRMKTTSR